MSNPTHQQQTNDCSKEALPGQWSSDQRLTQPSRLYQGSIGVAELKQQIDGQQQAQGTNQQASLSATDLQKFRINIAAARQGSEVERADSTKQIIQRPYLAQAERGAHREGADPEQSQIQMLQQTLKALKGQLHQLQTPSLSKLDTVQQDGGPVESRLATQRSSDERARQRISDALTHGEEGSIPHRREEPRANCEPSQSDNLRLVIGSSGLKIENRSPATFDIAQKDQNLASGQSQVIKAENPYIFRTLVGPAAYPPPERRGASASDKPETPTAAPADVEKPEFDNLQLSSITSAITQLSRPQLEKIMELIDQELRKQQSMKCADVTSVITNTDILSNLLGEKGEGITKSTSTHVTKSTYQTASSLHASQNAPSQSLAGVLNPMSSIMRSSGAGEGITSAEQPGSHFPDIIIGPPMGVQQLLSDIQVPQSQNPPQVAPMLPPASIQALVHSNPLGNNPHEVNTLQAINHIVSSAFSEIAGQRQPKPTDLYQGSPIFQRWLEDNWRTAALCMQSIIASQAKEVSQGIAEEPQVQAPVGSPNSDSASGLREVMSAYHKKYQALVESMNQALQPYANQAAGHREDSSAQAQQVAQAQPASPSLPQPAEAPAGESTERLGAPASTSEQTILQLTKLLNSTKSNLTEDQIAQIIKAARVQLMKNNSDCSEQGSLLGKREQQTDQREDSYSKQGLKSQKLTSSVEDVTENFKKQEPPALYFSFEEKASSVPKMDHQAREQTMADFLPAQPEQQIESQPRQAGQEISLQQLQELVGGPKPLGKVNQELPIDKNFTTGSKIREDDSDFKSENIKGGGTDSFQFRKKTWKSMSLEAQILKALTDVIDKQELMQIMSGVLQVLEKYSSEPKRIAIEANLPKKNHSGTQQNFRGSKYRGPSKNRQKWQVMKMVNKETVRIGAIKSEMEAARIYDFLAILSEGLNAKTNFNYNVEQLQIIIKEFYFDKKKEEEIEAFKMQQEMHHQLLAGSPASSKERQFTPKRLSASEKKSKHEDRNPSCKS